MKEEILTAKVTNMKNIAIDKYFEANVGTPPIILEGFINRYNPELWKIIYKDINLLGTPTNDNIEYLKDKFRNGK